MAVPGAFCLWRGLPPPPLRVGWTPLYRADRLAQAISLTAAVGKGRRPQPHRQSEGPGLRHGGGQGPGGGGEDDRLLLHRQCRQLSRGQCSGGRPPDLHLRPLPGPQGQGGPAEIFGATVISVDGSYEDTFELSKAAIDRWGWYNRNAAINPYLSEGKKTVTLEIMEQLHWQVPDYVALSVGDGCTIAGVWKGLKDLYAAGFIDRLPRLISVQAEGCCPLNRAIRTGEPWAAHGGEHPGRLHRRGRAPQRGQGPDGGAGVAAAWW